MIHWFCSKISLKKGNLPMYQHNQYQLIFKELQLKDRWSRIRKMAEIVHLSDRAKLRLEWMIFYHTASKDNATLTAKHFSISRSKFYFWFNRFDEQNLLSLEDKNSEPTNVKKWNPDPIVLERMINLRKQYPHWSKIKLAIVYQRLYHEKISSWQFQRTIQTFKLYPTKTKLIKDKRKRKKSRLLITKELRHTTANLFSFDTKIVYLFGLKYYILVAIGHNTKLSYCRAYRSHSSTMTVDFLQRLLYLVEGKVEAILSDNGSEFQRHFINACEQLKITRFNSRVRTPKDNPEVERMIKTLTYEWLNDGHCCKNLIEFNQELTEFMIIYNTIRPHQTLNYLTPMEYIEQSCLLSKRSSSSTSD